MSLCNALIQCIGEETNICVEEVEFSYRAFPFPQPESSAFGALGTTRLDTGMRGHGTRHLHSCLLALNNNT